MPPTKCAPRRIDDSWCRENRCGHAVNAQFARFVGRGKVSEARRGDDRRLSPEVVGAGIVGNRPCAVNDRTAPLLDRRAKGLCRWTPSSSCAHIDPDPRAGLCQGQHRNENQARQDHDFRFHAIVVIATLMLMIFYRAILIIAGFAGILASFPGCASVKSTAAYFTPTSSRVYAPKPIDAPVPILNTPPRRPFTVIGRLAFETDRGWSFLHKSMVYNAQIHGADAVILRRVTSRRQVSFERMPPELDWVPMFRRGKDGKVRGRMIPFTRPGHVQRWVTVITAIDAEMIVFEK
jgi:hypothetical protein